jgi:hypothetical protein
MKPLVHIFTIAYGEEFIAKYCSFALPSLLQPGNAPRLLGDFDVRFRLYTTTVSAELLRKSIRRAIRSLPFSPADADDLMKRFHIDAVRLSGETEDLYRGNPKAYGQVRNRKLQGLSLTKEIRICLDADAIMVQCTADFVFGNASLTNLVRTCHERSMSVAALILRVDEEQFKELMVGQSWPIENDRLATLVVETLHSSWRCMVPGGERNFGLLLGHEARALSSRLFAVTYTAPTVFATRFNKTDLALFRSSTDLRAWDGIWPQKLVAERRFVCLGSSDMALCAELTPRDKGEPKRLEALYDEIADLIDSSDGFQYGSQSELMRGVLVCLRTDRDVELKPL